MLSYKCKDTVKVYIIYSVPWLRFLYCTLTEVFLNLTEVFLTLTEVFLCFFFSCKSNVRVKFANTRHGPHSATLVVFCVVLLLFVLFYVLLVCKCVLPPGENPTAVNKYTISYHSIFGADWTIIGKEALSLLTIFCRFTPSCFQARSLF
jgi:hypothetical protein